MKETLRPGERVFSIFLMVVSVIAFFDNLKLFRKDLSASSAGAMPVFLCVLIFILALAIFIKDLKNLESPKYGSIQKALDAVYQTVLTKDIMVIFLLMLLYCIALYMGLGFVISTSLFLFISMIYLGGKSKKDIISNLIATVLCIAFIMIVFSTIFKIVLP